MSPLVLLLTGLAAGPGADAPWLPAFFSDHMVLQQETRAPLWGRAAPGERVRVRAGWGETVLETVAGADGRFVFELETPSAGGPWTIMVEGENGTRELRDVLLGEVWIASGQSNMEWTLGPGVGNGVEGWEEERATADDPELRFFVAANTTALAPAEDVAGTWRPATPTSAQTFSATAWFFARRLRAELAVPVGVISSEWGGTVCEAWTRAEALGPFPGFAEPLARLRQVREDPAGAEARANEAIEAYWRAGVELESGLGRPEAAACDDSAWPVVEMPTTFEKHGLESFDGAVWYRREVEVPGSWAGRDLVLELGPIDDCDVAWWDGEAIGGLREPGAWTTPRRYTVPGRLVRAGTSTLAVRVLDTGGYGGFAAGPEALRVAPADAPDEAESLAGTWRWHEATPIQRLGWPPRRATHDQNTPSVLWNGMMAPFVPMAVAGVIWYQGESNRTRAEQYHDLFPAMIRDWRAQFGRELPFYFVQIAPFGYGGDTGQAALLRDAQRKTLALPRTGMAVTMDIGNPADIHPLKKREVGERLARWALADPYGEELVVSGPLYGAMTIEDDAIRVEFEHAAGLTSHGEPVRHVTVAGADRVFHPAEARIEGDALVVWSEAVPEPRAVRFGWGAADETNLWNGAGLPASSFRTDDWPAEEGR